MMAFDFALDATDGAARAGTLTLPQGPVPTPCFMPVGTQGTVRTLSPLDLEQIESVLSRSKDLYQIIGDCGDEYRG